MPSRRGLIAPLAVATAASVLYVGMLHAVLYRYAQGTLTSLWGAETVRGGLWFALGLLGPMFAHEMAHVTAYRAFGIKFRGPFPIPLPMFMTGTLGAFIRLDSPYPSRMSMIVSGAAGPVAGLVCSVPLAWLGLRWSVPLSQHIATGGHLNRWGMPLYMSWLAGGQSMMLHPVVAGAWVSSLLTFANLLPFSHFDGGTILTGVSPKAARIASVVMIYVAAGMAFLSSTWLALLCAQTVVTFFAGWQDAPEKQEPLNWSASLWAAGAALALAVTWVRL